MNITLKTSQVNFKKQLPQEIQAFSIEELQGLIAQGAVIKENKQYLMIIQHRQITVECPIILAPDGSHQIIWPSFKLPNRPYPVHVYLYAAALYLSGSDSMRAVAQKVTTTFGLGTFSHTTICRFLQKLYQILPHLIRYGAQIIKEFGTTTTQIKKRKHWAETQYQKARQLIELLNPALRSPPEFSNYLTRQYWADTHKFIV